MTLFCLRAAKLTNDLKDKCFLAPFSCLELCLYSPEELHGVYVCVFGVWIANGKHQTPLLTLGFSLQIEKVHELGYFFILVCGSFSSGSVQPVVYVRFICTSA